MLNRGNGSRKLLAWSALAWIRLFLNNIMNVTFSNVGNVGCSWMHFFYFFIFTGTERVHPYWCGGLHCGLWWWVPRTPQPGNSCDLWNADNDQSINILLCSKKKVYVLEKLSSCAFFDNELQTSMFYPTVHDAMLHVLSKHVPEKNKDTIVRMHHSLTFSLDELCLSVCLSVFNKVKKEKNYMEREYNLTEYLFTSFYIKKKSPSVKGGRGWIEWRLWVRVLIIVSQWITLGYKKNWIIDID